MEGSEDQKVNTAETSDGGSFDRMTHSMTILKEDQKVLDALLATKREAEAKVQEQMARVKAQALQVIDAATTVLDRLPLAGGSESLLSSRLGPHNQPWEADCEELPWRFADGMQRVVTLTTSDSQFHGDITRSIRFVWTVKWCSFGSIYDSHAVTAWGYLVGIRVKRNWTDLSVCLVLHPGPNDSSLSWPFKKTCTITLVHPTDGSRDVHYRCVPPDTKDKTGPFGRPHDKPNEVYAAQSLCAFDFMRENGFIVNGEFCVRVEVLK